MVSCWVPEGSVACSSRITARGKRVSRFHPSPLLLHPLPERPGSSPRLVRRRAAARRILLSTCNGQQPLQVRPGSPPALPFPWIAKLLRQRATAVSVGPWPPVRTLVLAGVRPETPPSERLPGSSWREPRVVASSCVLFPEPARPSAAPPEPLPDFQALVQLGISSDLGARPPSSRSDGHLARFTPAGRKEGNPAHRGGGGERLGTALGSAGAGRWEDQFDPPTSSARGVHPSHPEAQPALALELLGHLEHPGPGRAAGRCTTTPAPDWDRDRLQGPSSSRDLDSRSHRSAVRPGGGSSRPLGCGTPPALSSWGSSPDSEGRVGGRSPLEERTSRIPPVERLCTRPASGRAGRSRTGAALSLEWGYDVHHPVRRRATARVCASRGPGASRWRRSLPAGGGGGIGHVFRVRRGPLCREGSKAVGSRPPLDWSRSPASRFPLRLPGDLLQKRPFRPSCPGTQGLPGARKVISRGEGTPRIRPRGGRMPTPRVTGGADVASSFAGAAAVARVISRTAAEGLLIPFRIHPRS